MRRIPRVARDALAPADQAVWDRIAAPRSGDNLQGPYSVLMHLPELAERVAVITNYYRSESTLAAADRELMILAAVRETRAHYAWARHEARARELGFRGEVLETLRAQGPLDALTPREGLLVEMVQTLLRTRTLPDDLFARGLAELGQKQMVEMVALIGHYGLLGLVLSAFAVPAPEGTVTF
jgi:4-carboxymuconolactone decarboxylase